jgi:asparaginyl-tRNA synthetase
MQSKHYVPNNHISNLIHDAYYRNLISLRNTVSKACDSYFHSLDAPRIDLFMVAKGVSSPMGKGSDSLPIPFDLGKQHVYLVDSAQFGMEPLVQEAFEMVYCYLPSFRGEDADYRHLNQFYHCEAELRGGYLQALEVAEALVKNILDGIRKDSDLGVFQFEEDNFTSIKTVVENNFPRITFDEAVKILEKEGSSDLIEQRPYGRVLTSEGELKICELVTNNTLPVWITNYDRDVVPFYQKPESGNSEKVLNADLIFPSIKGSFGGEIIGLGERQNTPEGILESMRRQEIHSVDSYGWYIDLRKESKYVTTSGFGLGIERLLAWSLGLPNIWDAAIYPVIKDEKIYY